MRKCVGQTVGDGGTVAKITGAVYIQASSGYRVLAANTLIRHQGGGKGGGFTVFYHNAPTSNSEPTSYTGQTWKSPNRRQVASDASLSDTFQLMTLPQLRASLQTLSSAPVGKADGRQQYQRQSSGAGGEPY